MLIPAGVVPFVSHRALGELLSSWNYTPCNVHCCISRSIPYSANEP